MFFITLSISHKVKNNVEELNVNCIKKELSNDGISES